MDLKDIFAVADDGYNKLPEWDDRERFAAPVLERLYLKSRATSARTLIVAGVFFGVGAAVSVLHIPILSSLVCLDWRLAATLMAAVLGGSLAADLFPVGPVAFFVAFLSAATPGLIGGDVGSADFGPLQVLRLAIWLAAVTAAELPYHSTVVAQGLAASVTLVQLWGLGTLSSLGGGLSWLGMFALAIATVVVALLTVAAAMVSSTFDGLNRTQFWQEQAMAARPKEERERHIPHLHGFANRENRFPVEDTDEHLEKIKDIDFVPIFVSGFHRSGTTYVYSRLCELLGHTVTHLIPYHVFHIRRLVHACSTVNKVGAEMEAMHWWQKLHGMRDRFIDKTLISPVTPAMEHGFPLLRYVSNFKLNESTADAFAEMCRKVLYLQGTGNRIILCKNPNDFGGEAEIKRLFPRARFIYIRRHPERIANSAVRALPVMKLTNPWNTALMNHRGGWVFLSVVATIVRIFGAEWVQIQAGRAFLRGYEAKVKAFDAAAAAMSKDDVFRISYEELIADPQSHLQNICDWIGLEPDANLLSSIVADPRPYKPGPVMKTLAPEIEAMLKDCGMEYDAGDF